MLFLIQASDRPDTRDLRSSLRSEHLEMLYRLKAEGRVFDAGARLDSEGHIVGSVVILEADDMDGVRAYLDAEVFVHHKVWGDVDISPYRRVQWPAA
ncbi:YciI family protein [Devosia salina]|uniref:YciI family protein n=1 Tax=Devosia salina TaxID=2860336 RepID=A0ABX8W9I2_9HYPH|nr:YciI family protein [Devosia salina]QYO75629.1 YciI family protein [Devosia salina]